MEDKGEWRGSATHLHSVLTSVVSYKDERLARSKSWPNSGNSLSRKINELASTLKKRGIAIYHKYDNSKKGKTIILTNIDKISSLSAYRSNDNGSDSEASVFDFVSSEKIEKESDLGEKALKSHNEILESGQKTEKDYNEVININQIADRIHEHSDIWKCKVCDHKGDKWDLLNHYHYCKNNSK
jgi:hypothetical protein